MIAYIFILISVVLYYLAYQSPRTDVIIYIFAGLFMLMGGVTGLVNSDLSMPLGSESVTNMGLETTTFIYSTSIFYVWVIPMLFIFLSLYLLMNSYYLRN